jgi:hypothetical protein
MTNQIGVTILLGLLVAGCSLSHVGRMRMDPDARQLTTRAMRWHIDANYSKVVSARSGVVVFIDERMGARVVDELTSLYAGLEESPTVLSSAAAAYRTNGEIYDPQIGRIGVILSARVYSREDASHARVIVTTEQAKGGMGVGHVYALERGDTGWCVSPQHAVSVSIQ